MKSIFPYLVGYIIVLLIMMRMRKPEGASGYFMLIIASAIILWLFYFLWSGTIGEYEDTQKREPWLVQGTKQANETTLIPGNRIPRSTDGQYGVEYSYGFWMFINQWSDQSQWKDGLHHILHKGDDQATIQCPGIWLAGNTNKLIVKVNTFNTEAPIERCVVSNIPVKKWVHVTVVVMNRYLDIYINGHLKKRCVLRGLPQQNYGNVYLNARGGFNGLMSRVKYFSYSLPLWKIDQLVADGPSEQECTQPGEEPPYLASDWWITSRYPKG